MTKQPSSLLATALCDLPVVDLKEWIKEKLAQAQLKEVYDGRVMMTQSAMNAAVPAAVLIPLVNREEGVQILLTQRTQHLYSHAGQISFPGGRIDPEDPSALFAALRETEEEIGLARERIEVLGSLRDYYIPSGFRVTPWVGWVEPPFDLTPDPFEVDQIFEIPLHHCLNPSHHELRHDEYQGRKRRYYVLDYPEKYIWGATAGMMVDLYHTLTSDFKLPV